MPMHGLAEEPPDDHQRDELGEKDDLRRAALAALGRAARCWCRAPAQRLRRRRRGRSDVPRTNWSERTIRGGSCPSIRAKDDCSLWRKPHYAEI